MSLNKLISEAKNWSINEQVELCRFISQNITIAIRSIYSYPDKTDKEKIEAVKWINEFHHRINNLRFEIERVIDGRDKMELLGKHAIFYANQNDILKNEMSAVLAISHKSMSRIILNRKKFHLMKSIFDLIESENFRKRIGMYIGEDKITTLRGFIEGYFYALDSKNIHLRETEPKFEKFQEWVSVLFLGYNSSEGWKDLILKECNGDEKAAIKLFFEIYDKFKQSELGEHNKDE